MSPAETPIPSQADRIEANQRTTIELLNDLGDNMQWIVDNVKGIFEMFNNPAMMGMMSGMIQGGMPNLTGALNDGANADPK